MSFVISVYFNESIDVKIFLELDDQLPVLFGDLLSEVLLEAVDWSSRDEGDELGTAFELLSDLHGRVSSDWDGYTSCDLSGLFQLLVVVLDRLNVSNLDYLHSLLRVFWIFLFVEGERSSDSHWAVFYVNSKDYRIVLSEDSNGLKDTWENCFPSLFVLPLLSNFSNVFCEVVSQMIDNISSEDFDLVFLCVLLGVLENLDVEYEHACKSK